MTTKVWLEQQWSDTRLSWQPSNYNNIEYVLIPADQIWLPDIVLINNWDGTYYVSMQPNVVVSSNGHVTWRPPAVFKSLCKMEVAFFPFDLQQCEMIFSSINYDRLEVKLQPAFQNGQLDKNIKENGEWDILGISAVTYLTKKEQFTISYRFELKRKSLFYIIYLIIPSVAITFLAVFTFVLPSDSGEKMTLVISCLLSLTVFILLLLKIVPPTSMNIPLINKFLMFMMVLNTISVLASVVVLNIHYRTPNTHVMPVKFRQLFISNLPRWLNMQRPPPEKENDKLEQKVREFSGSSLKSTLKSHDKDVPTEVIHALQRVDFIVDYLKYEENYENIKEDWKFAAMVIDRFLFYVFTFLLIVGTTAILL